MSPTLTKHRNTEQRKVILEELSKVCTHPTAQEIYQLVKKKLPEINLSTIYRNLQYLEDKQLIIRLQTKEKEARYDGNVTQHCHLCCKNCGKVIDIWDCKDIQIISKQLIQSGFQPDLEYLEIPGYCKQCIS